MEWLVCVMIVLAGVTLSAQDKLPSGCLEAGQLVSEGSLVPRNDPCHVCYCHGGRVRCFWKSCSPPPELCHAMQLEGRCNPSLYVCPIPDSIADAPIQAAQSVLTPTRRRRPVATPQANSRPRLAAGSRARSRTRSRTSAHVKSPNSATVSPEMPAPVRSWSRRRRPSAGRSSASAPTSAAQTGASAPTSAAQTRATPPAHRSTMKIVPRPRARPVVVLSGSVQPPPAELDAVDDSLTAASVAAGSTYFNEVLSVPRNFVMPGARGGVPAVARTVQQVLDPVRSLAQFHFGPSPPTPTPSSMPVPTQAPTPSPAPTPTPLQTPSASPAPPVTSSRSRGGRHRGSARAPSGRAPVARKLAGPSSQSRSRQSTADRTPSRAPAAPTHRSMTDPLMNFDYDIDDEDIDLRNFMFPEFGRRLRRDVEEPFDATAVRRLEVEWSARRRRRSLLPSDNNHVHGNHHDHAAEERRDKTCSIMGVQYELGEVIGVASDNCLECRCAAQAMFCSPKCCFFAMEERVLRQDRQLGSASEPRRPHPLRALISQ